MPSPPLTLPAANELHYFAAVAATGNLSRAAERLGISQPSLTAAMQRLEQTVGSPLLMRHAQGVTLTPAGQELQLQTRHLLDQWAQLVRKIDAAQGEVAGRYIFGCHSSVALHALPLILPSLTNRFPKLEWSFVHGLSRHMTEDVISRRIDMALAVNPVRHPELVIRRLWREDFRLWQHQKCSVAAQQTLIYHPDLLQTRTLLKRVTASGLVFARHFTSPDLDVIASLVAARVGVGVLPARVTQHGGGKKIEPVTAVAAVKDEVCLVYRAEHKAVRSFQLLVSALVSAAALPDSATDRAND